MLLLLVAEEEMRRYEESGSLKITMGRTGSDANVC